MHPLVQYVAEGLMVVAIGGMLWSAASRVRRGQVKAVICPACQRTASRAYRYWHRCGALLDQPLASEE